MPYIVASDACNGATPTVDDWAVPVRIALTDGSAPVAAQAATPMEVTTGACAPSVPVAHQ
jgi:hypothetical protein